MILLRLNGSSFGISSISSARALLMAPVVEQGLRWFTIKLNFHSEGKVLNHLVHTDFEVFWVMGCLKCFTSATLCLWSLDQDIQGGFRSMWSLGSGSRGPSAVCSFRELSFEEDYCM